MKAKCRRCEKSVEYTDFLPEKCPFCHAPELVEERSDEDHKRDVQRLKIEDKLLNIPPASKKRRWLLLPLLFFDLSIPILGYLLTIFFSPSKDIANALLFWLGTLVIIVGAYRVIYYAVMTNYCVKGVKKAKIDSVYDLTYYMRLKTRRDTLLVLKRQIKYGILTGVEVVDGEKIQKTDE